MNLLIMSYLVNLQNKIFKLLPMKESYASGADNHLDEYLDNLCDNIEGAFVNFPELAECSALVDVQNNIAFLNANKDVSFKKWRSTVLRSTRLVHDIVDKAHQEREV